MAMSAATINRRLVNAEGRGRVHRPASPARRTAWGAAPTSAFTTFATHCQLGRYLIPHPRVELADIALLIGCDGELMCRP